MYKRKIVTLSIDDDSLTHILKTFVLFPLGISTFLYLIYYYNLKLTKRSLPKWMKQLKRDKIPKKVEHRWELHTFTDNTAFCNHCNLIIVQGVICTICQRTAHIDHIKEADLLDCKCGAFISHRRIPDENNDNNNKNNKRWYQKGLLKRGSSWISRSSRKSDDKKDEFRILEESDDKILDINETQEPLEIDDDEVSSIKGKEPIVNKQINDIKNNEEYLKKSGSLGNLKRPNKLHQKKSLYREISSKEEELLKDNINHKFIREESVVYPNEEINKNSNIDKSDTKNNVVMLRGSSYYNLRESSLFESQSSFQENPDQPNNPFSGILRDPKTGIYHHQWVKYKTPTPYFCQVCSKRVSNGPLDYDYHCVWCQICIHKKCIQKYNSPCYLSIIPEIVMPPHYVSLANKKKKYRDEVLPKYHVSNLEGTDITTKRPLICVINPKSGEGASSITREMYTLLNPIQICDITYDKPEEILLSFIKCFSNCRVIACGGDGTVSWINSIFDKFLKEKIITKEEVPPIGVVPLGTGNDLSRVLGWGGGYEGESAISLFKELAFNSEIIQMDRWKVTMNQLSKFKFNKNNNKTAIMNNYFSIGSDANIAYAFHTTRKEHPSLFKSRIVNKIWYLSLGAIEVSKSIYKATGRFFINIFKHKKFSTETESSSNISKKPINTNEAIFSIGDNSSDAASISSEVNYDKGKNNEEVASLTNSNKSKNSFKSRHSRRSNHNSFSLKNGKNIEEEISANDNINIINDDRKSIKSMQSVQSYKSTNQFSSFDDLVELVIDGNLIDVKNLSGIIVLNINSYGGGSKFFQKEGDTSSGIIPLIKNTLTNPDYPDYSCNDHQLEVVGVYSALHAGASLAGVVTPEILGVVKESLKMTTKRKMAVQVDGEPWMQNPSVIEITFNNKAKYLKHNGTNLY